MSPRRKSRSSIHFSAVGLGSECGVARDQVLVAGQPLTEGLASL